jgi:hypothetical protein
MTSNAARGCHIFQLNRSAKPKWLFAALCHIAAASEILSAIHQRFKTAA